MLGYKLSEILGKLSLPGKDDDMGALDREYKEMLKELTNIRNNYN